MPVSTDSGEPPAKCCKFCDESTQGVDGSASWRLTLDQDLVDTLKGSFPNWFTANSTSSTSITLNNNHNNNISNNNNNNNNNNNCTTINHNLLINNNKPSTNSTTDKKTNSTTIKNMAEGERSGAPSANQAPPLIAFSDKKLGMGIDSRQSPPKAVVDSSPLQPQMDKNKESLKVKLMVRRSVNQLVEQGIMPPLKTSPALHEQRKQLLRAKTGDLLKAKIQSRPDRQELERRHILELQEGHIDPSLAEKRRMLEKALLADQLNSKISHRPGPLELIEKNILHTEEPIERIVKEGLVPFQAANESAVARPQHTDNYVTYEDDSQSSEGDLLLSPQSSRTCDVLETAAQSAGITVALSIPTSGGAVVVTSAPIQTKNFHATATYIPEPPPPPPLPIVQIKQEPIPMKARSNHQQTTQNLYAELCQTTVSNHHHHHHSQQPLIPLVQAPSPSSLGSTTSSLSPLSSVASPPPATILTTIHSQQQQHQQMPQLRQVPVHLLSQTQHQFQKSDAPGKDKNRKKSKAKPMAKVRSIKFHEYKGPPNAQKSSSSNPLLPNGESNYQLIMKQQYLLEYLEGIYKHPPLLPANQKPSALAAAAVVSSSSSPTQILVSNNSSSNIEMMTVQVQQPSTAILSHSSSITASTPIQMSSSVSTCSSIPPSPASSYSDSTIASELTRLNRMKVSDLKQQLKKLNLPVSGPKPQLIDRLKPYLPLDNVSGVDTCTEESISGDTEILDNYNSPRHSMSPESDDHESMDCRISNVDSMDYNAATPCSQMTEEDIVREQQKKIDELQRKLKQSQEELEQVKQKTITTPSERSEMVNQKLKQQLEARIHKEKLNQLEQQHRLQKEHLAFQKAAKNQPNLFLASTTASTVKPVNAYIAAYPIKEEHGTKMNAATVTNAVQLQQQQQQVVTFFNNNNQQIQLTNSIPTFVVVGLTGSSDGDKKLFNAHGHQRGGSLSGIVLPITTTSNKSTVPPPPPPPLIDANTKAIFQPHQHLQPQHQREQPPLQPREQHQPLQQQQQTREQSSPPVAIVQPTQHQHIVESQTPPPQYEEATKHLKNAKNLLKLATNGKSSRKGHMMSQDMTDVLEILIKHGELPQSAADPTTPTPQQAATLDNALKTLNKPAIHESNELLFNATSPASKALVEDNHHISYSDDIPSALLLDSGSGVLDLNVLSPMQQDEEHQYLSMDDAFKMISQATPPPPCLHNLEPPLPEEVEAAVADIISLPSDDAVPILTDFNDLDLMEFQMDIEDDSCGHHQQQQQQQNSLQSFDNDSEHVSYSNKVNGSHQSNVNNNNGLVNGGGCRRNMNPSLQPSLNDIIQQQHQQQQQLQTQQQNGFNYNNNLHDSYVDTPMDFENLLANFDIPSLANSGLDNIGNSSGNNHLPTSYDILGSPQTTTSSSINYHHHHHQNHYLNHHSPHHDNILDLFNEDYRMTLSDPMSCEVDNLLCNI